MLGRLAGEPGAADLDDVGGPSAGLVFSLGIVDKLTPGALLDGRRVAGTRMNPVFEIAGQTVVLHPLDMVSVALEQLGPVVGSLAEQGQAISDALDELLTRSWG